MLARNSYLQAYVDDSRSRMQALLAVVKLAIGSEIKLAQADFVRLNKALFAEIEAKFT